MRRSKLVKADSHPARIEPTDLPRWAEAEAVRAARYVIHPSDDLFKAEQRRVPAYKAARRRIVRHVKQLEPIISELSEIDRAHVQRALDPIRLLAAGWEDRDLKPSRRPKGKPRTSADRDVIFHGIVTRLVVDGWSRAAAMTALARFIVEAFPPTNGNGARVNGHLYGAISSGYNASRVYAKRTRQREAEWSETPIADRARRAFIAKLRAARIPRRNK